MIKLTRLSHEEFVLNSDLIEYVEAMPDTVITLTTGQKLRVRETPGEVVEKVVEFRGAILGRAVGTTPGNHGEEIRGQN
jgi:flagellar protein FlbD